MYPSLIRPVLLIAALGAWLPAGAAWAAPQEHANIHVRGDFNNSRIRFEREKQGHVAFIGGSITEMNGYRPMVSAYLGKRFPDCRFTFTDAGIASTCSTTGAFRLTEDVLSKGTVDLFFIEFAVNDDQDADHTRARCIRGMEGIVRQALAHNPRMDIVITYFVNPQMLETLQAGKTPLPIAAHEAVAEHYGVTTVDLAREVADQIGAGSLTWDQYGGTHPAPRGNAIAAGLIERLLDAAWDAPLPADAKPKATPLPEELLDRWSYVRGRFIDPAKAAVKAGWRLETPNWKALAGSSRSRFENLTLLCADQPGSTLTLKFSGTGIGAYVLAGPDAGTVIASVDGGEPRRVDLYHRFSKGLHYPRTVMFFDELPAGEHTLRLQIADDANPASTGHAARILQFTAN